LESLPPEPEILPVFLSGTLRLENAATTGREILVVSSDGAVVAVTRVFDAEGSSARFEVMIPPDTLRTGENDVVVWLAVDGPEALSLQR
jgi:hypothetical protein